jgi:hypothetical protein
MLLYRAETRQRRNAALAAEPCCASDFNSRQDAWHSSHTLLIQFLEVIQPPRRGWPCSILPKLCSLTYRISMLVKMSVWPFGEPALFAAIRPNRVDHCIRSRKPIVVTNEAAPLKKPLSGFQGAVLMLKFVQVAPSFPENA